MIPHNIKAIYKLENKVVKEIFYNPYYEARENEPELSFKEGEDLYEASKKYEAFGKKVYKNVPFNKNYYRYNSQEDFRARYGKKEMEAKRDKLYAERGYRNYKEQFEALPRENWQNWPSTYVIPNPKGSMKRVTAQENLSQAATPKTSSAARISNPFAYITGTINQIKGLIGGQMLESSKQMAEDLLDEKVNKKDFVKEIERVTKDIETDVHKLDKLSEKLKKSGRSDSKTYRDKLIDLEVTALELEQELKTFEGKENMPKGRLEKLESKTKEYSKKIEDLAKEFKKVKGKTSSPEKKPEITIKNPRLKEIAEQYKTLSKEGKALLDLAKGKDDKSKHKISDKYKSPKDPQKGR